MAGFSLGGGGGGGSGSGSRRGGRGEENSEESIPPESLFIYGASNTATNTRGFELWQHQQQQHHLHQFYSSPPTMLGFSSSDNIQLGGASTAGPMRGGGSSSTSGGVGGMSCQDCGNQAKKDCPHMRCRTCCKSRGFHCTTHVRSTWVPASRRRERQQQLAAAAVASASSSQQQQQQQQRGGDLVRSGSGGEGSKRPRELLSSNARAVTATGGMEAAGVNFPAEVSSPAVFRCVRVSSMDEAADDEFAYQTAVSIGGHMFRGILYDQGPQAQYHHQGESSSSTAAAIATTAAAATAVAAAGTSNAAASAGLMQDPSSASMYPTPLSAFMAGTQFFPHHPRP